MVLLTNTAEGGTNTTAVTTANSGGVSGDAWAAVQLGDGTSALTFTTEQAHNGTLAYKYVPATSQNCSLQWDPTVNSQIALRYYVYLTANPVDGQAFTFVLTAASGTIAWIRMNAARTVSISDSTQTTIFTSTAALSLNTWHRVELKLDRAAGTVDLRFYAGDDTTLLEEANLTAVSLGATNPGRVRFGRGTAGSNAAFYTDDLAYEEARTTYLGPASTGQSANLTQVAEVSIANPMTGAKSKTLAQAVESNTAQPVGAALGSGITAWTVEVDWDNDGDFADTGEDVTLRVLDQDAVDIAYGRDTSRALSPQSPGTAALVLNNDSRDYSPENAASPLFGDVRPGRDVRIKATHLGTEVVLFQGFLDSLETDPVEQVVNVTCRDVLSRLSETEISTPLHQGVTTGRALHLVLDEIGWPLDKRDIDTGATAIRWWWAEGDAGSEVEKIVQSEGPPALITVDADGNFVFRDRHNRIQSAASLTSQATFRDAGNEPVFSDFSYEHGWQDVINSISFAVEERDPTVNLERIERVDGTGTVASLESVMWESDTTYSLSDGEILEVDVELSDPIYGALVPVAGVDYTVPAGAVEVWLSRTSGQSAKIFLKGTAPTVVADLRLRAYPVEVQRTVKVTAKDQTSITANGVRSFPDDVPWAGEHDARSIAASILAHRAEPLAVVTVTLDGGANATCIAQQLTRDLSDRVTVVESHTGMNADVHIGHIRHSITGAGERLTTTFGCEKTVEQVSNVLKLDVGQLDVNVLGVEGLNDPDTVFVLDEGQLDVGLLAY